MAGGVIRSHTASPAARSRLIARANTTSPPATIAAETNAASGQPEADQSASPVITQVSHPDASHATRATVKSGHSDAPPPDPADPADPGELAGTVDTLATSAAPATPEA
ncbi:hypothetical protein GCM10023321_72610 [Pseudonocardia eucalypti]|uniref:Uncharacterized protein n=1 Tax=Pseudonocardia eucalypti TaxID=648755 RepID=A0ABP9R847_9PSEU